jgi:sugar phosphate permease
MSAGYRAVGGGGEECGVVSSVAHWDAEETRCWLALQFTGLAALYFARFFLVVSIVPMSEELGWDERQCGIVLSAFYWGYVLTQVLGGSLSDRYGGDVVQWVTGVVWSLSTLSSVYLAQVSIWPLVLARFLTGLAQGQLALSLCCAQVFVSVPLSPKACITQLCPV